MIANTAQPISPFDLWAAAGFKADLLPIIPPGAPLSAKSSLDPSDTGKTPGLPMNSGKWTGFPKWAELHADDTHMAYWGKLHASHGVGVGLQARNCPGVDIDVLDAGVSDLIAMVADAVLGPAPERVGRAPKRLMAYAWDGTGEPIRKRRVEFFLPGDADTKHAVEVLGHGQQYVVEGIHPKTGNPYTWTGGKSPVGIGTAGLTPINGAMLDAFMAAVEQAVVQAGGAIHTRSSGTGALDRANVDQSGLSGDAARVREALEAMGNDCTYDEWITMSAAIKAALDGDEALYPIYEAWCLAYPGNTAEMARHKWDSLHPPYRVGAEYVFEKARAKGWTGYATAVGIPPLPDTATDDTGTPLDPTEDGVALRFGDRFAGELQFDHTSRTWFAWSGVRWQPDKRKSAFAWTRELCREVAKGLGRDRQAKVRSANFCGNVERFAQADQRLATTAEVWDADPMMLGHPTGMVDLNNCTFLPPNPALNITKLVAATPDDPSNYHCPHWEKFLDEATGGSKPFQRFLQQLAGYCLTGDTSEQKLFFIHGDGGTGKSTYVRTLAGALADYAVNSPMETFTASKHDAHPTELAMLAGARLVTASETERGRKWAESRVKMLTGGDPVTARFMRQDHFSFIPQLKLVLVGNHAPALSSVDDAMRRRLVIIPFRIRPQVVDKELPERLRREHAGILGWALHGLQDYLGGGRVFALPTEVTGATDSYISDQDLMAKWLSDRTECDDKFAAASVDLFNDWAFYARLNNADAGTQADFKEAMERRGFVYGQPRVKGKQVRGFKGIRLADSAPATKDITTPDSMGDDNGINAVDDLFRTAEAVGDDAL